MKSMKKASLILIIAFLLIMVLSSTVSAATVSIGGTSKVTVGKEFSVTVSFGEQVKAAQFKVSYDTSKFEYTGKASAGTLGSTGYYSFLDTSGGHNKIASVTFTFKAKATGSGTISISNVTLPVSFSTSRSSITVTVEKAASSGTTSKPNTNKKPTTNKKPEANTNTTQPPEETPTIEKTDLYTFIQSMTDLKETDYTEESWKALQDAIAEAENATTEEAYNAAKAKFNLESLVPQTFEKPELDRVLRQLIGKLEKDYTQESWSDLLTAIDKAETTKLKSEYEEIKDKLTINNLILEEEKGFFEELLDRMKEDPLILGLVIAICVLVLILIIVIIMCVRKNKEDDFMKQTPRRMR